MNRLSLLAKLIVVFVLFAANARAQCVPWSRLCEFTVSQTNGRVTVTLGGGWPDGCGPRSPRTAIWGRWVSIHLTAGPTTGGCSFGFSGWWTQVDLGVLPAGSYTAYVTYVYPSAPDHIQQLGTFAINVPGTPLGGAAASPVPATHPVMTGLLVFLVLLLTVSLRSERSR